MNKDFFLVGVRPVDNQAPETGLEIVQAKEAIK